MAIFPLLSDFTVKEVNRVVSPSDAVIFNKSFSNSKRKFSNIGLDCEFEITPLTVFNAFCNSPLATINYIKLNNLIYKGIKNE